MLCDVVSASYKDGYQIELTFDNGESGVIDFSPYLQRGGIFKRFREHQLLSRFSGKPGTRHSDMGG